ncbi:MAG: glycosyltransferase family 2 protein [Pseudomonadota bacterium]
MAKTIKKESLFSMVTVNYNRSNDLSQLLDSLSRQTMKGFEVVVVDNASRDDSLQMVQQNYPEVKIISLKENTGVTGFNIGVENATFKYSVLLDNDVILPPNFVEQLYETVNAYPDFTVFALNIITPDGIRQKDYLPQHASTPMSWHNFIGGGAVFLTSVYKELGGYDPNYFIYINETELSARLLLAGKKILYCPHIKLIHKTSSAGRMAEVSYFYFMRNSLLFMRTYFKLSKAINLTIGFLLINLKGAVRQKLLKTYIKAVFEASKVDSSRPPVRKLDGGLEKVFSSSWQGDPSLSSILARKL